MMGTIGAIDENENLHIEVLLPGISAEDAHKFETKCGRLSK